MVVSTCTLLLIVTDEPHKCMVSSANMMWFVLFKVQDAVAGQGVDSSQAGFTHQLHRY